MKTHHKPVIVVDFGGVYFTNGFALSVKRISKKFKISLEKLQIVMKSSSNPVRKKYIEGKISGDKYWKDVSKKLKITMPQAREMERIWNSSYKPQKGMRSLISKIKKKHRVIVLSGNVKERVDFLRQKYNIDPLFHDQHYSFHHGVSKPDVRLFKRMIKKAHLKPQDCIMIDDMDNFLASLRKLGAKTILFKNAKQLEKQLKKMGVTL
jgi:HAD superfamily hydrolase (TIGR01509 family)